LNVYSLILLMPPLLRPNFPSLPVRSYLLNKKLQILQTSMIEITKPLRFNTFQSFISSLSTVNIRLNPLPIYLSLQVTVAL
jgi:hypothetical protein